MASSIRVVFEIDNRKYIADVKRAEDATTKFAKTTEQGLNKLKPATDQLNSSFTKLSGIVATIGISAFVSNVIRTADAFNNLSNATDVGLDSIIGLSNALVAAGGSSDKAVDGISDLVKNLGEARAGSSELQKSFAQAGVTISDLQKLSNQDILRKTIKGLAEMTDKAKANSIGMKLMGESIKGVDLNSVNANLDQYVRRAGAQADASRSATAANTNLAVAFTQLQEKVLIAIKPITDFIASLSPQQIDQITSAIVDMGKALIAIAPAMAALRSIGIIFGGLGATLLLSRKGLGNIATASAGAGNAMKGLSKTAEVAYNYIDRFRRGTPMFSKEIPLIERLSTLFGKLGERGKFAAAGASSLSYAFGFAAGGLLKMIPLIGQAVAIFVVLNEVIDALTGKNIAGWIDSFASQLEDFVRTKAPGFANALDKLGEKLGMAPSPSQQRENANEITRIQNRVKSLQAEAEQRKKNATVQNSVKTELSKFALEQGKIVEDLESANRKVLQRISFEKELIGLGEDEQQVLKAREEALQRQQDIIRNLVNQQAQLKLDLDPKDEVTKAKIGIISETILRLQKETGNAQGAIERYTRSLQAAEATERMRISGLKQTVELENLRASLLGFSTTEQEKFNQALNSGDFVNKTKEEVAQLQAQAVERDKLTGTLTAERIARETNASLLELETSILGTQFTALQKLEQLKLANPEAFIRKTQDEIAALTAQATKIDEVTAKLREQAFARDLLQQGQDFAQGIRDEMSMQLASGEAARRRIQVEIDGRNQLQAKIREINQSYGNEKNLSEALRQQRAREIADATAGIGKLQAAKAQAVADDQAMRDSFNFGWETAFNKYAEDALNAANQSKTYFETFTKGFEDAFVKFVQTGKFSFKDLANSIIADFARIQAKKALVGLFGGGGGGGIFGSIGKIFGFANGGNPAIGNPILVGERGPELMIPRNASTIIPNSQLGGGSSQTSVTYNIQAVDAQSFQSMLARDPSFLHAVAEKGRRSMPQGVAR